MRFVTVICGVLMTGVLLANPTKKLSIKEYIDLWKGTAISSQTKHAIPASITLAQAILESGNGNSRLATEGNNHFGIKCHDWKGDKIYQDDDQKNDCFRKYTSATESFEDHSLFLKKPRYEKCFELESSDYAGWAKALKNAGYATHPEYAQKLIDIIEKQKLYELDGGKAEVVTDEMIVANLKKETAPSLTIDVTVGCNIHEIKENKNRVKYVVVKKGDTFCKIAKECELTLNQLYRYNDFDEKKEFLKEGDIVYLSPKRNKAKGKHNAKYVTKENTTLTEVSQKEGIKLKSLMELNEIESANETLPKGKTVLLR